MENTTVFLTLLIEIQRLVIDVECYSVSLVRVEPYDVHFILNKVDKPLKSMQKLNQLLN